MRCARGSRSTPWAAPSFAPLRIHATPARVRPTRNSALTPDCEHDHSNHPQAAGRDGEEAIVGYGSAGRGGLLVHPRCHWVRCCRKLLAEGQLLPPSPLFPVRRRRRQQPLLQLRHATASATGTRGVVKLQKKGVHRILLPVRHASSLVCGGAVACGAELRRRPEGLPEQRVTAALLCLYAREPCIDLVVHRPDPHDSVSATGHQRRVRLIDTRCEVAGAVGALEKVADVAAHGGYPVCATVLRQVGGSAVQQRPDATGEAARVGQRSSAAVPGQRRRVSPADAETAQTARRLTPRRPNLLKPLGQFRAAGAAHFDGVRGRQ
mmetsp:Transcript_17004/g.30377  ORF Transcript_17004/g.30377 Transcript_17004/m.30377 type:complete len:322 (+) Transcript_17004:176-1141(+)